MPGFGSDVGVFILGKAQQYFLGLLAFALGHAEDISKILVEVDIDLTVGHMGELHAEYAVKRIVAEIGVVAVAAEEEPAVVVLLQVVGVDDERLGICHSETLIAQLHSGLLADGVEEWGEVLHTFIIHGRLEANCGAHFFMIAHAEVETVPVLLCEVW